MNRNEKLAKLATAVSEWRGAFNPNTGKWTRHPKEKAVFRVAKWLERLGRKDVDGDIALIQTFTQYQQFNAWIASL